MPPNPKPRRIEYVDVDDLPDAPTNAKRHATDVIEGSINRFGMVEPIVIDERTGRVVSGHGRRDQLRALRDAGRTPPEGVVASRGGVWLVPVARGWSSVDDVEAEAAGVALNRVGEVGGWHDDVLADTLQRLAELPVGLAGLGYDGDDLNALLASLEPKPTARNDPDDVPPVPKTAVTKHGDVWALGSHRLLCGDATSEADHERLLGGVVCDLVLTDPPYGVGVDYGEGFVDDAETVGALIGGFMPLVLRHRRVLLTPGRKCMWNYPPPTWVLGWVHPASNSKGPWGFLNLNPVLAYGPDPFLESGRGCRADALVLAADREGEEGHPVIKPIAVWMWLMERGTVETGQTVFDPFVGSGTTLIAAHELGRVAYGIELSPAFCDVAVKRWVDHTGETATNLTTGATWLTDES